MPNIQHSTKEASFVQLLTTLCGFLSREARDLLHVISFGAAVVDRLYNTSRVGKLIILYISIYFSIYVYVFFLS